jgi:hypothetical protein
MKKTRVVSLCVVIVFIRSRRELFFGAILSKCSKKTEEVQLENTDPAGWSAAGRLETAGEVRILNPVGVRSGCTKNLSFCNSA